MSLGLLVLATAAAAMVSGAEAGGGVALAGGLVLVNFQLWQWVGRTAFAAVLEGRSPALAAALWGGKLALLVGGIAFLVSTYPAPAVALGCSVVVGALLLQAAAATVGELSLEEA